MISQSSSAVNRDGIILFSVHRNKLGMLLMDLDLLLFFYFNINSICIKVLVWVIGEERPNSNIYSF